MRTKCVIQTRQSPITQAACYSYCVNLFAISASGAVELLDTKLLGCTVSAAARTLEHLEMESCSNFTVTTLQAVPWASTAHG